MALARRLPLLLWAAWVVACGQGREDEAGVLAALAASVEADLPGHLGGAASGAPTGAAWVAIGREGTVEVRTFGTTGPGGRAVDGDTLFSMQSMTKVVTGIAVMTAVEDGALDLDAPISRWVPDLRPRSRFAGDPAEQITLRLLLSHRSGLTHEAPVGNNASADAPEFADHVESIAETWLRFPVGAQRGYSNLGVDLAGFALGRAVGSDYETVVRARVLGPLGMRRSAFATPALASETNRAVGAHQGGRPPPIAIPMKAAGGLYTSANEIALLLRMMLDRGGTAVHGRVLEEDHWREMHRIVAPVSVHQRTGYGLGVAIQHRDGDEAVSAGHGGGGYGFSSHMTWLPRVGLAYAVLLNGEASGAQRALDRHFVAAARKRADDPFPQAPVAAETCPKPALDASPWLGVYRGRTRHLGVQRDGDQLRIGGARPGAYCLIEPGLAVSVARGRADAFRFEHRPGDGRLRMVRLQTGVAFDYNDGPRDAPGPDDPDWRPHLGTYLHEWYGRPGHYHELRRIRGHLYWSDLRLSPGPRAGLFVAANGETLELDRSPPRWRGIALRHVAGPLPASERSELLAIARDLTQSLEARDFAPVLERSRPKLRILLNERLASDWDAIVSRHGAVAGEVGADVRTRAPLRVAKVMLALERSHLEVRFHFDAAGGLVGFQLDPDASPRSWWLAPGLGKAPLW